MKEVCNIRMKIGFVIYGIGNGGLERRTVNVVNELSNNKKNEIVLVTGAQQPSEYELVKDVFRVQLLRNNLVKDVYELKNYAIKNEIDVLVGMGLYANWLVCLTRFLCNCKVIVVESNDPRHDNISVRSRILRKLLYWKSDGFIFQTEEEKCFYSKKIQKRAIVIHNPVKEGLPYRDKNVSREVIAIGRMLPQKNYEMLLRVFRIVYDKFPEYRLRIFGQGPEDNKLKKLAAELNILQVVEFEGFCTNLHEKIVGSDIFVLTSDFEGMPNVLLETMAMGFPVISTDCGGGGPRELIIDGENGLLTPVGNPVIFAEKLCWMIDNPNEKEKMAQKAYMVRETHALSVICKEWLKYIESV